MHNPLSSNNNKKSVSSEEIVWKDISKIILSPQQRNYMVSRFPKEYVKLSYETVSHKKVSTTTTEYDICMAIPYGKKAFIWFTYFQNKNICCVLELNRENQIGENVYFINIHFPQDMALGTILSGVIYETSTATNSTTTEDAATISTTETPSDSLLSTSPSPSLKIFIADDIHAYHGMYFYRKTILEKFGFLYKVLSYLCQEQQTLTPLYFATPILWRNMGDNGMTLEEYMNASPYPIRHIQYRSSSKILPHLNLSCNKKTVWTNVTTVTSNTLSRIFHSTMINNTMDWNLDLSKTIYKMPCILWVSADIAHDVYILSCKSSTDDIVAYQNACVLNYKTSVLLNKIFRNIRENDNLDAIEESDDEEDFENIREDKYVDLEKRVLMECHFHMKFRKWVPIRVLESTPENIKRVPKIDQLCRLPITK